MEEPGDELPAHKRQRLGGSPVQPVQPCCVAESGKTEVVQQASGCVRRGDGGVTVPMSNSASDAMRHASDHRADGTKRDGVERSAPRLEGRGEKGGRTDGKTPSVPDAVRERWDHVEPVSMQLFGGYRDASRRGRMAHEGRAEPSGGSTFAAAAGAADPQLQTAPWLRAVASDLQAVARFRWLPVVCCNSSSFRVK